MSQLLEKSAKFALSSNDDTSEASKNLSRFREACERRKERGFQSPSFIGLGLIIAVGGIDCGTWGGGGSREASE